MDSTMLRAAMTGAFKAAGGQALGWADPAGSSPPLLEPDFERCADPIKYQILAVRARAWARALRDLDVADVVLMPDHRMMWQAVPRLGLSDEVLHVAPRRDGAVPLVFALRALDEVPEAQITVAAGDPCVAIDTFPESDDDADDTGSAALLDEFDDAVLTVVTGAFVSVATETFVAQDTLRGRTVEGSVTGVEMGKFDSLFAEARAGTSPHRTVYGRRWW